MKKVWGYGIKKVCGLCAKIMRYVLKSMRFWPHKYEVIFLIFISVERLIDIVFLKNDDNF